MVTIITEISKFIIIILMICYTMNCFTVFRPQNIDRRDELLNKQIIYVFGIHFLSYLTFYLKMEKIEILIFYGLQITVAAVYMVLYHHIYPESSRLITNNMSFLMLIGYTMLTRLDLSSAKKQFMIGTCMLVLATIIPFVVIRMKSLKSMWRFYAVTGIIFLFTVFIPGIGKKINGSRNWIKVGPIQFQPMEFVKIIFVFFLASILAESAEFQNIVKTTMIAALYVGVLVLEKDLGGATIFFVTYAVMIYIASGKLIYLILLFGGGGGFATVAYIMFKNSLFSHVSTRILAWSDPWAYINNEGYQVAQSLFAIGTGGFFGSGLTEGSPNLIPVASSDFIFSAIGEEYGMIFAIALILMCVSCFVTFMNAAMKCKRRFFKYLVAGFAVCYIFQVFLNIGGATKFIPSTGVTLPLVSYGLSSMLSTIIIFSLVQTVFIIENKEAIKIDEARKELEEIEGQESGGVEKPSGKRGKKNRK